MKQISVSTVLFDRRREMQFIVRRTSEWDETVQPCKEAVRIRGIRIDERTVNDPAKIKPEVDWWTKTGKNHRVERGHIKRDFDCKYWIVEIASLAALMAFYRKYGDLVIRSEWDNEALTCIEIYDGYRE